MIAFFNCSNNPCCSSHEHSSKFFIACLIGLKVFGKYQSQPFKILVLDSRKRACVQAVACWKKLRKPQNKSSSIQSPII